MDDQEGDAPAAASASGRVAEAAPPLSRDLQDALERIAEGFALFDRDDRLIHCNERFRDLYPSLQAGSDGAPTFEQLTRELAYGGLLPAATGREETWIAERLQRHRKPGGIRHFTVGDGRWLQVDEQRTGSGGTVLVQSDVTAVKAREQAYALFATAVDQAGDSIELSDADARIIYVNPAFTALTGYAPTEALGRSALELLSARPEEPDELRELERCLAEGQVWSGRLVSRTKAGAQIYQDTTISPLRDETGRITNYVTVKRDVTAQIATEMRIRHLAHHDALTDLPNRSLFQDRLRQALAETRRTGQQRALMLIDLDHFKEINDTLGHAIGDGFLCQVGARLQACVREADTAGRLGGDEFGVIQGNAEGPQGAATLARRIIQSLSRPFVVEGHEVRSSASVGITLIPDDGQDPDQLMRQADLALYRAKSDGRGTYRFFLADYRNAQEHRASLEQDLTEALRRGQLSLDFQPLIDLESTGIHGLEALLRWRHPTRGPIPPQTIIPLAEAGGLLVPLTSWVLKTACDEACRWQEQGLPPVRVAVNLSAGQFRHHALIDMIEEVLATSGLPGHLLELEVQETAFVPESSRTIEAIRRLNGLGVQIAVDDFGSGVASLAALRRVPLHKIKIDRTFVQEACSDPTSAAMIKAIIELGKSLRLRITAEGVETEAQLLNLKGGGCQEVQGFLLSRPLPPAQVADFIRKMFARPKESVLRRDRPLTPAE